MIGSCRPQYRSICFNWGIYCQNLSSYHHLVQAWVSVRSHTPDIPAQIDILHPKNVYLTTIVCSQSSSSMAEQRTSFPRANSSPFDGIQRTILHATLPHVCTHACCLAHDQQTLFPHICTMHHLYHRVRSCGSRPLLRCSQNDSVEDLG